MDRISILLVDDPAVRCYLPSEYSRILHERRSEIPCNIKIVEWEDYWREMTYLLSAGIVDIVMVPGHVWLAELVSRRLLQPIDPDAIRKDFLVDVVPSVFTEGLYEGALYLLPSFTDGHLFFDALGLLEGSPSEWIVTVSDIVDAARMRGQSLGASQWIMKADPSEILTDFLPFLWACGGQLFDDQNVPVFPDWLNALEWYVDCRQWALPESERSGNAQVRDAIKHVKASGISWGGQSAPILEGMPSTMPTYAVATAFNASWGFALSSSARDVSQAYAWLNSVIDSRFDECIARTAGSPVRKSTYAQLRNELPWLRAQEAMLQASRQLPRLSLSSQIFPVIGNAIWQAYTGQLPPSTAWNEAYRVIKKMM